MHAKLLDKKAIPHSWILIDNIKSIHVDPLLEEIELTKKDGTKFIYSTEEYQVRFITEE